MVARSAEDAFPIGRHWVRFPVQLRAPAGFRADDLGTWPRVEGRVEYVDGRLLYRPPCAEVQQEVAVDVVYVLRTWAAEHPEFVVGANEAGMRLGGDVRAADAGLWRRKDTGAPTGKLRTVAPILAVEVESEDEEEGALDEKARWYLRQGVLVVWVVRPRVRDVVVHSSAGASIHAAGTKLPAHDALPGLVVDVARLFEQIDRH